MLRLMRSEQLSMNMCRSMVGNGWMATVFGPFLMWKLSSVELRSRLEKLERPLATSLPEDLAAAYLDEDNDTTISDMLVIEID